MMRSFKELRRFNLDSLQTLKAILTLLRDPSQTESVYDVEDGLCNTEAMKAATEKMMSIPEIAQLVRDRYIVPTPDLAKLLLCPDGSLGKAYANYITGFGFDPDFYRKMEIKDDMTYLLFRLRQTHDIWHVVAGFSVDVAGEIGIKAFELAQTHRPLSGILIAGAFLQTLLKSPRDLETLLSQISRGYQLGLRAKPFLAQRWEEHWEKPLAQWREELGVTV